MALDIFYNPKNRRCLQAILKAGYRNAQMKLKATHAARSTQLHATGSFYVN